MSPDRRERSRLLGVVPAFRQDDIRDAVCINIVIASGIIGVPQFTSQFADTPSPSRGLFRPSFALASRPNKGRREGRVPAGTRGLLREDGAQRDRTAAYRCSRTHGLPCAVVGRLMPCSPGSRVPSGLPCPTEFADTAPVGANVASAKSLTVATTARTTRFCRTQASGFAKRLRRTCPASPEGVAGIERRSYNAACKSLTGLGSIHCPALQLTSATAPLASTATRSAARDDVRPPLFAGPGSATHTTNPNFGKVEYFDAR
jgi:hypothetical protein